MRRYLSDIWDAIRGYEHDYTRIRLSRAIVLLAIPMVAEMLMESLFAILDIFYVSRLGDEAISVVGITESLMTLVYAIGVGLAMATTGLVARRIGEKHDREAAIASSQAILLGVFISMFFALPGWLFPDRILSLMHAEPDVIVLGTRYTKLMMGGNFLIMLLFVNNAIFRSAGAPALSLRVLIFANLINIILDPCLIFGLGPFPELGVTGAAVATNIGRGMGVVYQFYILFGKKCRIQLRWIDFRVDPNVMWKVLYLSGGGISQYVIATSSWIFLYRILAGFKSEVVAGYTIAIRIFIFFLLPAWGLSNAASTLVGQNLGAKNPQRAEKAVWLITMVTSGYLLILMLIFLFLPYLFVGIFTPAGTSHNVAIDCLKIVGLGMIFYGAEMILMQAFNGAGDTYTPTLLNIIGFWLVQVPLAIVLSKYTSLGHNGVFYSIFISESIIAVLAIFVFLRGKWKLMEV